MRIKVVVAGEVAALPGGAVAAESMRIGANWIVLDRSTPLLPGSLVYFWQYSRFLLTAQKIDAFSESAH